MKTIKTYKNLMYYRKRWLLMVMLLLFSTIGFSQGFSEKNTIYLIGQITNNLNGGPIKEKEVVIISDTTYNSNFSYSKKVTTDSEGYFYDTIPTYELKGSLIISTEDYLNVHYDTTVYFRFTWTGDNILFANFILPVEIPSVNYQANFYYQRDPSGYNNMEYQFYDITNSNDIISWEWNFGDGNFSNEPNPGHIYSDEGIYRVKLIVLIQDNTTPEPYETTIVKIINVSVKDYFNMGGHVFAEYFPIDMGEVYLYKIEPKDIVLIDTAFFNDTLGHYCFYQLIEGEYIIKADLVPNSIYFNQFMTTYYSNKPTWLEADTIFLNSNNFTYHINLIPITQNFTGPGKVSGTIHYSYDPGMNKGFPAENVEILLYNNNNEPIICCHSNENGEFDFCDLELGSYNIHPEVTGKYTYELNVTLSENYPEIEDIKITISDFSVNGYVNAIEENNWANNISQLYPNPAKEVVNLEIDLLETSEIQILLFNNSGQLLKDFNRVVYSGKSILRMDISGLNAGVYFLKITDNVNKEVSRRFLKR
ncbi:MAG: hypothetical protein B6D61_03865 [Bacteroidetes bacterium 4484_249]|nr:MAG: hypothetical protein B6D61_03865 [Bacteroidetes bacterium 4484_249]